ncbi:Wadjet anti-phage system protein JetD domain-containing protein [Bariatricus sp. HCP28S3_A7]|uniref:Wadjet anti-phage system protein JetD domain-containing protein n=1 Tax=unclassified Bariatricus TaxID=2677046 RepID=UPI003F88BD0A
MYLVKKIIEKCEHSSRDWREGATGGRTLRITQEDYDLCGKQELIDEARKLESAGLLTIKKWVIPDSDIELIAYRVEKLSQFYRLADSESGEEYWPKQARVNYYTRKIEEELSEGFQKEWIEQYFESLRARLGKGEFPKEVEKLEMSLAAFRGIDSLEEPVLKRIFSKQYLKDSKMFERELERHVISVARKYCDTITEDMDSSTVLEQLMIEEYSQELAVKGPLKLKIWRGSEAKRVDLSDFVYGTVLNSQTLKHAVVELDQPGLKKVVTIENKANYVSMPYQPDTLYVFSHGYFSPLDREFLKKLRRALNGKPVEYFHSGDLDYGGVKIYEYIKKQILPDVQPLKMDVETFEKYASFAEPISKETMAKLQKTEIPDLKELIDKMIETGMGIEQESFLIV